MGLALEQASLPTPFFRLELVPEPAPHQPIVAQHFPDIGASFGFRAECGCGDNGDWTTESEAEFDCRFHIVDTGGSYADKATRMPLGAVHVGAARRRENYLFMLGQGESHEGACVRLQVNPNKFADIVETWKKRV